MDVSLFNLSQLQEYNVLTDAQIPNFSRQQCHQQALPSLDKITFCSFNEIWLKNN